MYDEAPAPPQREVPRRSTETLRLPVLRTLRGGWPVHVRVDYASLQYGDLVEVSGAQLRRDGTPEGRVWFTLKVDQLSEAVVGWVDVPHRAAVHR